MSIEHYDYVQLTINSNEFLYFNADDFNRVVLEKSTESNGETDYINASFINVSQLF